MLIHPQGSTHTADVQEDPMLFPHSKSSLFALGPVVLCLGLTSAAPSAVALESTFGALSGYWAGDGMISVASGANERIRCKATYAVSASGESVAQTLRCASDSFKLEISSNVTSNGGALSGVWSEATRGATGSISGRVNGSEVNASVSGTGFSAVFSLSTKGKTQYVNFRPQGGTEIRSVTITLHKI
jgi:hypothetical protein